MVLVALLGAASCEATEQPSSLESKPGLYTILGGPACAECEIFLDEIAVLGDPQDSASIREDATGRGCMRGPPWAALAGAHGRSHIVATSFLSAEAHEDQDHSNR